MLEQKFSIYTGKMPFLLANERQQNTQGISNTDINGSNGLVTTRASGIPWHADFHAAELVVCRGIAACCGKSGIAHFCYIYI